MGVVILWFLGIMFLLGGFAYVHAYSPLISYGLAALVLVFGLKALFKSIE
jgi:hypothetical protein